MLKLSRLSLVGMTSTALIACLAFLISFGALRYYSALRGIDRTVDLRLQSELHDLVGNEEPEPSELARRIAQREAARASYTLGYLMLDAAGHPVAGSVRMMPPPLGASEVDYSDRLRGLIGVEHGRALAVGLKSGGKLVLIADSDPTDINQRLIGRLLGAGVILSGLLLAGGMAAIALATKQRLASISATAQAILSGDMTQRLTVLGSNDEFDREARLLNEMLDRITGLMDNLRNVSNDIAHDLRTPLARLKGRLVAIETLELDHAARAELEKARAECDDLLSLFGAILRLSEIHSGQRRAAFVEVRLDDIIRTVVDSFADPIDRGGRSLTVGTLSPVVISGDRMLLSQMIVNAIENAVQHTPVGTAITISLERSSNGAALAVADNGPGITAENHGRALRRFGRLSQDAAAMGHGLGLNLIQSIAQLHGAVVQLGDNAPGLVVCVRFSAILSLGPGNPT